MLPSGSTPLPPCGDDENLQDFSEATIKALEVLHLQVESLMLSRNWDELVDSVFAVCEAAHAIPNSINRVYRERTGSPFIGHVPQTITPRRSATPKPRAHSPSLTSLGDLL